MDQSDILPLSRLEGKKTGKTKIEGLKFMEYRQHYIDKNIGEYETTKLNFKEMNCLIGAFKLNQMQKK